MPPDVINSSSASDRPDLKCWEMRGQKHTVFHSKKQKTSRNAEIKTEDFVADNWSYAPSTKHWQVTDLNKSYFCRHKHVQL